MHFEQLRPAYPALPPWRCGVYMVAAQESAHGQCVDGMPQVGYGSLEAAVAPRRILCRHPDDALLVLLGDTWSATWSSLQAPVILLCDQALIPPEKRLGRDEGGKLFETL